MATQKVKILNDEGKDITKLLRIPKEPITQEEWESLAGAMKGIPKKKKIKTVAKKK